MDRRNELTSFSVGFCNGSVVGGRVFEGEISVNTVFNFLEKEDDQCLPIELRVSHIRYYDHPVDELFQGDTGQVHVEGQVVVPIEEGDLLLRMLRES